MSNWKKRLKKGLRRAAPLAALGLGAMALGRRKYNTSPVSVDSGRGGNTQAANLRAAKILNDKLGIGYKTDPILHGGAGTKLAPEGRSWGSYWPFKKGGRVRGAGKAKRGLGRAFTKAKK
jgi:hypothetical protein